MLKTNVADLGFNVSVTFAPNADFQKDGGPEADAIWDSLQPRTLLPYCIAENSVIHFHLCPAPVQFRHDLNVLFCLYRTNISQMSSPILNPF